MTDHPTGNGDDRAAAQAVVRHHAQLAAGLDERVESVLVQVESGRPADAYRACQDLLDYLRRELVPHARAEEHTLYAAATELPGGGPLVTGMLDEHRVILELVEELAEAPSPIRAAGAARALAALFATHLRKENELILPMLVGAPGVALAGLLAGMHELLGAGAHEPGGHPGTGAGGSRTEPAGEAGGCGCGGCGCGGGATGPEPVTIESRTG